jgi:hypothetical protein
MTRSIPVTGPVRDPANRTGGGHPHAHFPATRCFILPKRRGAGDISQVPKHPALRIFVQPSRPDHRPKKIDRLARFCVKQINH